MKKRLENQKYTIIDNRAKIRDWNDDKYTKFLVTIALRLGIAIDDDGKDISINFSGKYSEYNDYHESVNYVGTIAINDEYPINNVKICTHKNGTTIATLWPIYDDDEKQDQAKNNKTSEFIEYYKNGARLFTVDDIATYYHPVFLEFPGFLPMHLEMEVCARKLEALKNLYAEKNSTLIDENDALTEALNNQIKKNTKENLAKLQTEVDESLISSKPGVTVTARPRKILMSVKLQTMHSKNRGTVQGVVLHFDDGTSLKNNWDGAEERKAIIDKLIGREVVTDVWGNYLSSEWFANVYLK